MVVITILGLGMLALTSTSLSAHSLQSSDTERRLANDRIDSVTQDLRRTAAMMIGAEAGWVPELLARYGPGGNPGNTFTVRGLNRQAGNAQVGTITIITDETMTDAELGVSIGMPRDLDNDGLIDNDDVTDTARLLPVILRVDWNGKIGNQQAVEAFYVLGY